MRLLSHNGVLYVEAAKGPRGGNIIGKTKSGKPIYGPSKKTWKAYHQSGKYTGNPNSLRGPTGRGNIDKYYDQIGKHVDSHNSYTSEDHQDAEEAHSNLAAKLRKKNLNHRANIHDDIAHEHAENVPRKGKGIKEPPAKKSRNPMDMVPHTNKKQKKHKPRSAPP